MRLLPFLLLLSMVFVFGCRHEEPVFVGGKGGVAKITVYPQHHGIALPLSEMVVYIKYDTRDVPASGIYDDSVVCVYVNNIPTCAFDSLKNGDYYFFSKGYDNDKEQKVRGGTPYTVKLQSAQTILIPVSEDNH